jgi:hypothetical protein
MVEIMATLNEQTRDDDEAEVYLLALFVGVACHLEIILTQLA